MATRALARAHLLAESRRRMASSHTPERDPETIPRPASRLLTTARPARMVGAIERRRGRCHSQRLERLRRPRQPKQEGRMPTISRASMKPLGALLALTL